MAQATSMAEASEPRIGRVVVAATLFRLAVIGTGMLPRGGSTGASAPRTNLAHEANQGDSRTTRYGLVGPRTLMAISVVGN